MKRFKHILGYIPHNSCDEEIVHWCGKVAEFAHSSSVDLIICYEDFYQGVDSRNLPWDEFASQEVERISALADKYLNGVEHEVIVHPEAPMKGVLERLAPGSYDLLVLPKKTIYGISLVEKFTRKSPVGVLVVPEGAKPTFKSIMLGLDFADISSLALEWAEAFAEIYPGKTELNAVHVVNVPDQSKALQATDPGMLRAHYLHVMTDKLNEFITTNSDQAEKWNQVIAEDILPGLQLLREAKERGTDLIVIGSHGRNALSIALLGGQTSDVIRETKVPLLVAKRKNESLGFLKQLLGISH